MRGDAEMAIGLEIRSRLDQVRLIRAALSGLLAHHCVVEDDIHALELAATEVVNNCIEHGYGGAESERIIVRINARGDEVQLDVTDDAAPFPEDQRYRLTPQSDPLPEADEMWSLRGHGLQIVNQIVDSISLKADANGNTITLRKKVSRKIG